MCTCVQILYRYVATLPHLYVLFISGHAHAPRKNDCSFASGWCSMVFCTRAVCLGPLLSAVVAPRQAEVSRLNH